MKSAPPVFDEAWKCSYVEKKNNPQRKYFDFTLTIIFTSIGQVVIDPLADEMDTEEIPAHPPSGRKGKSKAEKEKEKEREKERERLERERLEKEKAEKVGNVLHF